MKSDQVLDIHKYVELAKYFPKLAHLELLECIYLKELFKSLLPLKHLQHLNVVVESEFLVQKLCQSYPLLATLYLGGNLSVGADGLHNLVTTFPGLETLHTEACTKLTDAGLVLLAQGLPRLRCLILKGQTEVSPEGILQFAKLRGGSLDHLAISWLPENFTMIHFRDLLAFCPNLLDTMLIFENQKDSHGLPI